MTFIPEEVIQEIQALSDIRQIVAEYVPLKKRGNNYVGLCPFHHEKTPSFTVNEDKQIFHCFGCGVGGNIFKFLMLIEGMSFVEAVRTLADRYGVVIPQKAYSSKGAGSRPGIELLVQCSKKSMEFYHEMLTRTKSGTAPMDYLKKRGIGPETIHHFQLGWAPEGWDSLVTHLRRLELDLEAAREAGLLIAREGQPGRYYDRFRGRVIFPIHDRRGNVVALGGRVIGDGEPKYLNSPESPIYQKRNCLYGYYLNKSFIRKEGLGFVVEGYMDLVALYEHGVKNVVATLGTALTEAHARLMKGLTKDWVLVFDADEAGMKAAQRALPAVYQVGLRPRVLSLPNGHDPDSFVRAHGREAWERLVEKAEYGIDFVIGLYLMKFGDGPDAKMEAADEIVKMLREIDDPVRKSLLISYASQRLGVREELLMKKVSSVRTSRGAGPWRRPGVSSQDLSGNSTVASAKLLSFILSYPHRMEAFKDEGLDYWLSSPALRNLWLSMVHAFHLYGGLETERFLEYIEPLEDLKKTAQGLLSAPPPLPDTEETIKRLKDYCTTMKNRELRRRIIEQLREDEEDAERFLKMIKELC